MALSPAQSAGHSAENLALAHLKLHGFRLLDRNYRIRGGELDLVMARGGTLAFIEVRMRNNPHHGSGAESVDWRKRQKLIRTAEHYLSRRVRNLDRYTEIRFDVVSITNNTIHWIPSAFTAD